MRCSQTRKFGYKYTIYSILYKQTIQISIEKPSGLVGPDLPGLTHVQHPSQHVTLSCQHQTPQCLDQPEAEVRHATNQGAGRLIRRGK
jgi:hypothetical protein